MVTQKEIRKDSGANDESSLMSVEPLISDTLPTPSDSPDTQSLEGQTSQIQEESLNDFYKEADNSDEFSSGPSPRTQSRAGERHVTSKAHTGDTQLLSRYILYETASRFYLVGQDVSERYFKVLKIDRTSPPGVLNIFEDEITYDKRGKDELLTTIDEGNKASGGLRMKLNNAWGILGFIRFTEAYYMVLITKRSHAAVIGGHYISQIEATEIIPLTTGSTSRFKRDRNPEETRYLGIFANIDLAKSFYYSHSYNITRTLQHNICRYREDWKHGVSKTPPDWNDMFIWNHHLLDPARAHLKSPYSWCIPIIHGFIEQESLDIFGRRVNVTIIARRSRFFAGARYLKRGANDQGYVANDVETEQIVADLSTTSFHAPGPVPFSNANYTSYVQHRGSIPLFWSQDNSGVTPKPDIEMNLVDPFYTAAALHFNNLFHRYGAPIYVLNLIKARERTPRESKLLKEFEKALIFLNQSLPEDQKILYKAFDMSRAAKTRGQDVIGVLEMIADQIMDATGFFQIGDGLHTEPKMQNGVARTNCIDCLDRTNAAQFVIGKKALGRQLQALGVIENDSVEYDSDAVNTFTHMYHSHGDTIAIQYGGSHLAHTMSTYRKINEWKSHSRDVVESFKRYYHNSFLDSQRQEAYNLFLGNFIYAPDKPMLWDLTSDYYLHHTDPRLWISRPRRSYINWYDHEFLIPQQFPTYNDPNIEYLLNTSKIDDYWLEYYRPFALSTLAKTFALKINARSRYIPEASVTDVIGNPSPFVTRRTPAHEYDEAVRKTRRQMAQVNFLEPAHSDSSQSALPSDVHIRDFQSITNGSLAQSNLNRVDSMKNNKDKLYAPDDRSQWTLKQWYENSLSPTVNQEAEYVKYVDHPQNLAFTISASDSVDPGTHHDFSTYLSKSEALSAATGRADGLLPISAVSATGRLSEIDGFDEREFEITTDGLVLVDEATLAEYSEFLATAEDPEPLTVREEDNVKKRYKAYRQWLKGRSFFKLYKLDPEYKEQNA